ncbi:hypothetical protein GGF37_001823 [Kickxella alabastrina]|nr:hypothetical protein GGF37_001823 [Kickxella alabastrina]
MNSFNSFNDTIDDKTANQHIVVDKPGVWNSQDSYRFYCELANYTKIKRGVLFINHQYLDNRDIHLIELLENKFKHEIENNNIYSFNEFRKNDIVHYLEHDNESSPEKDCLSLFKLLCNLQIATKNKFTMRQLNNKHINTRSRWTVPLKNLNEIGYFVKNQAPKGMRPTPEELVEMTIKRSKKTNMESKNNTIVKALQKYAVSKQLYWCEQTNSVPLLEGSTLLANTANDYSEADRWICAMISKHGKAMVSYMDKCVVNLVNSYLCDKHESMDTTNIPSFVTHETPPPKIAELLDQHPGQPYV